VSARPEKILALQFKYLGDAVFITPALRALKENQPDMELHVLVAAEVAPLLENLPWLKKVWALPRTRGRARLLDSWPLIRALRREHFDRAVDFGGNDRGALLSFFSGAKIRLAAVDRKKLLQKICYTQTVSTASLPPAWVSRHLQLLAAWQIPPPKSAHLEIVADPAHAEAAAEILADGTVLCHLGTSQLRKEWPVAQWRKFFQLARAAGLSLAFSAGNNERERGLLAELKKLEPEIFALPPVGDLKLFLAVLQRARLVIAGDTGPLHFAAGLGVPVLGLFGTADSRLRSAPIYSAAQIVTGGDCFCDAKGLHAATCADARPCMAAIPPEKVFAAMSHILGAR
jgi:ADP-heptose:LPS heptosyltransferase